MYIYNNSIQVISFSDTFDCLKDVHNIRLCRAGARTLIGGGGVYSYIRVMSD